VIDESFGRSLIRRVPTVGLGLSTRIPEVNRLS
jgi:hypothetical protein